jgi:aspartate carbamoyltransferase catalytic subunit
LRHLLDPLDFSVKETDELIALAKDIIENGEKYKEMMKGKILAALFYEASTRTRLSFESAMISLGGSVIGFSSADSSSAVKGESVADTIRVVSCYADICAMRHPKEGSAYIAAQHSSIPVINAGDGGHQHPTQTLGDLLTISMAKEKLSGLKIGICGDLKFGRTVHSLTKALSRYDGNEFILVSPAELKMPSYIKDEVLRRNDISFKENENLEESISEMDILYMTRVQKERFFNEEDYVRLKDTYILDKNKLKNAKEDLAIMHPLPRVNEIKSEIDSDPRAIYFEQVLYGKFMRMALILKLMEAKVL